MPAASSSSSSASYLDKQVLILAAQYTEYGQLCLHLIYDSNEKTSSPPAGEGAFPGNPLWPPGRDLIFRRSHWLLPSTR